MSHISLRLTTLIHNCVARQVMCSKGRWSRPHATQLCQSVRGYRAGWLNSNTPNFYQGTTGFNLICQDALTLKELCSENVLSESRIWRWLTLLFLSPGKRTDINSSKSRPLPVISFSIHYSYKSLWRCYINTILFLDFIHRYVYYLKHTTFPSWDLNLLRWAQSIELLSISADKEKLYRLGQTEYVPPEDGERMQSLNRCVF
jgi:hypothetical protein